MRQRLLQGVRHRHLHPSGLNVSCALQLNQFLRTDLLYCVIPVARYSRSAFGAALSHEVRGSHAHPPIVVAMKHAALRANDLDLTRIADRA